MKARKLLQVGYFLFYCPFMGGCFNSMDLEMGVRVRLGDLPAYGRLTM